MAHEADRPLIRPEAGEDLHDVGGVLGVERTCRLIGQHDQWLGHDRPGDGHALLLASRHLDRTMVMPVRKVDLFQCLHGATTSLLAGQVPVEQRRLDVAERRQVGHEVELLEHESDGLATET